ncbi:beta-propeller fold lactonase family protein [Vacuolonema iberomarrocanum]|uniref:beta-propeller fold lactonase family protein n=1 Tax=Vacuolonema iberomarrocanum TaxID=3454632 RepID=UPI003F6E34C8
MLKTFAQSLIASLILLPTVAPSLAQDRAAPMEFQGRYLVSISDADMVASAYVDGSLGPREGIDALSIIPLRGHVRDLQAYEVEASNSVAGPPVAVAVTPDGRYAIVIETWAQRPDGAEEQQTFGDLTHGDRLQVFDLADPTQPTRLQDVAIAERPASVSINADGSLIAVSFHPNGAGSDTPLALIPFENGQIGEPVYPTIPGFVLGEHLIHAEWHPSRDLLALANETTGEISFVEVTGTTLRAWGNVVQAEKAPYMVRFTPDGRYAIANALYWGADVEGLWTEAPRGSIVSIRLEAGTQADGSPRHALVSRAMTGVSPEGIAISPDGRYVVTTNLERSYLPYDDDRITWFSSLSLITLDPETGQLNHVADYPYDGILPEAAAFDASGQYLAVANYDHFDDRIQGSSIDFWRIATDPLNPQPMLVQTRYSVPVTRGAHSMVLVP